MRFQRRLSGLGRIRSHPLPPSASDRSNNDHQRGRQTGLNVRVFLPLLQVYVARLRISRQQRPGDQDEGGHAQANSDSGFHDHVGGSATAARERGWICRVYCTGCWRPSAPVPVCPPRRACRPGFRLASCRLETHGSGGKNHDGLLKR